MTFTLLPDDFFDDDDEICCVIGLPPVPIGTSPPTSRHPSEVPDASRPDATTEQPTTRPHSEADTSQED